MLKTRSNAIGTFFHRITSFDSRTLMCLYLLSHTDPFSTRSLHSGSIGKKPGAEFVKRMNSLEVFNIVNGGLIKGGKSNGLTLRSCFDSHSKADRKVRALAQHRQILRGVESGPTEILGGGPDVSDFPRGGYLPGNFRRLRENDKIIVAVDIDEVLGNFVSALNRFIADRYAANHSVSEYHVYEFFKIWKCSRDEADIRVHEFFKTSYFKKGIHPLPGAQKTLQKLSRFCDLSVVTSRQNAIKEHTLKWIKMHFPGLFREIHFGNHFALHGESRPKSEICRSFGAEILIDDNPRYAIECADIGMKVLLFDYENSYPWSKVDSTDQHPLVIKVRNWEEVEQQMLSLVVSKH